MQEVLKKIRSEVIEPLQRSVTLCIKSQHINLSGAWMWEMQSTAVYCSDVMFFPEDFVGTKGIIHPDDIAKLNAALDLMEDRELVHLDFRIITTYGEVKTISGQRVSIEQEKKEAIEPMPGKEPWQEALEQLSAQKENDFLQLRAELGAYTERLHGIGSWLMNKQSGQSWYSDNVFRIHGLAPQSLNAHANTFNPFIHKDDRITVADAFEKAYAHQTPLHIEYRIVPADGETRYVQQITQWFYNVRGQDIFGGIICDVTEERRIADELLSAQSGTLLHQHILKISEQQSATGYWFINLATRKASYSENYYRIYGIRQAMFPAFNSFLNFVHGDDRPRVRELIDKMFNEHVAPEMEFRIIRPNGKIRHLKQSGKMFITPNKELVMIGLVQDISVQKVLEKKILELNQSIELNRVVAEMTETAAGVTFFAWLPEGYMKWSDGFYRFLGYKPGSIEPLPRFLHKTIHSADLKIFRDAEALLLSNQSHDDIVVRFISKGGIRQARISFRQADFGKNAVIALVHDISKQTEAQQQFVQNKLYADLLTGSVTDLVLFTNPDHTITHWNAVAEEKTGIKKEDALQHNLFDVLPRLNDPDFLGRLHLAVRGHEFHAARVHNYYLRKAHDYWLWPLKNEQDEVLGVLHIVHDISRQLELQQQLSERLNFIENLVESSVDRIVVLDRFMNYLYWNKKAEQYYAINKERVLGKNILEIFPSFRNDPGYQQFRTVLKGETVYLPPAADEETGDYFETYLIPVKGETGEVSAVLWVVHDLSREYQLTKERTQTANLLHATMNASADMIQVFEAVRNEDDEIIDFRYVLLNHEAEKWMPGAIGKSLLQFQPGVVEEGIFDTFKRVVETGVPDQSERHYVHEQFNGWFYQSTVKLNDGVATTTRDITERKKAEQEILRLKDEVAQKATDKYYSIFNSIDEGFCIFEMLYDDEGRPVDYRFAEVNPAFERQTGLKDIIGKTGKEIFPGEDPSWVEIYDRVLQTGEPVHFENYHEGTGRWYRVYTSGIGNGDGRLVTTIFEDITGHKRIEKALRINEARIRWQKEAFQSAVNGAPLEESLNIVARMVIEETKCEARTAFYIANPEGTGLYTIRGAGNMPDAYADEIDGSLTAEDSLACVLAVPAGEPVLTPDVYEEQKWKPWTYIADKYDFRACWSFPVKTKANKAVGTFAVYFRSPCEATPQDIALADIVTQTAAVIISNHAEAQERIHAETALRASEENYRSLFNAIEEGFVLCELVRNEEGAVIDHRFLDVNPAFEKYVQLKRPDVIGRLRNEVLPPDNESTNMYAGVVLSNKQVRKEFYSKALGQWFDVSVLPRGGDRFAVIFDNITERKTVEEKMRSFNAELEQQIIERTKELQKQLTLLGYTEQLAQTGSWEYETATGNFTWSEGMYRLFGLPLQMRIRPETYLDFAAEEDRSVAKRIVRNLKKKHEPFEEVMKIKKGNEERLLKIKASVIPDEKGRASKIIGVDLDITDMKQAEERLKESRHWLEQTTKASPDVISVYDLQKREPVYLNNCLAEWTGIAPDELVQMGVEGRLKLIHEDDRLKVLQFNEKIAASGNGDVFMIEYRIVGENGQLLWVRNRSRVFLRDGSGNVTHLLSILQNVTHEVQLREELKKRTQYAEAIIDASIDRIAVYDKELRIIAWNKRSEEITGRRRQDVLGQKLFDVFPKIAQDKELAKAHADALEGSYVGLPARRGIYTNSYYERFYIPLKNEKGEVYAIVSIMHDVSDLVHRNTELNELNRSLEQKNTELEQKNEEVTSFAFVASHDMREPLRKIHTFSDWLMEKEAPNLSEKGDTG